MKEAYKFVLITFMFVVLATAVFRCAWDKDRVFIGSDSNIGLLMSAHQRLPEGFSGAYLPTPLFGSAVKTPLSFSNVGKALLDPVVFSNSSYSIYLILASLFLVAYLRLWKLRWPSCLFGSLIAFWVGSITLSSSGHLGKLGVMAFCMAALYLLELSVRSTSVVKRVAYSVAGGVSVGLMLLEQQDVGLLAGLILGPYVIFRLIQTAGKNTLHWAQVLIPVAVLGLLLSASTALNAYSANVSQTGMRSNSKEQWDFVTQWSMVPSELPDLVAPGLMGWKTGHPELPYWGAIGQSPEWQDSKQGFRNFRLDSLYIGIIPILLGIWAFVYTVKGLRKKDELNSVFFFWGVVGVIALALSMGKYCPLYKMFYQLPLVGNIRAPIKLLHNVQVIVGILAALGIDRIFYFSQEDKNRESGVSVSRWVFLGVAVLMFLISILYGIVVDESRFSDWGADMAGNIVNGISRSWLHGAIMAVLLAGLVFARYAGELSQKMGGLAVGVLIAALGFDSIYLSGKYFESTDISQLRKGNLVINYLKENQGNERVYFLQQQGPYASWVSMESQYHGLNRFNIWQMPRMPAEYKEFLSASSKNPIRMWQLASIRYITAPAGAIKQLSADTVMGKSFSPVMFFRFVRRGSGVGIIRIPKAETAQDQVLLRFDSIPRFALYTQWEFVPIEQQCEKLFSPEFDPKSRVLVEPGKSVPAPVKDFMYQEVDAKTTLQDAVIKTSSETTGLLLFTQRHQNGWRVTVDGKEKELLKCNFLCMGVVVPAGEHDIRFIYN